MWRALSGTQPASVLVQFNKESYLFCVVHTCSKVIFSVPIFNVPVSLPVVLVLLSVRVHCRLSQFCVDCNAAHKVELTQVLYPVFVHVYLDLIAGGHSGIGTYMNSSIRTQPSNCFTVRSPCAVKCIHPQLSNSNRGHSILSPLYAHCTSLF